MHGIKEETFFEYSKAICEQINYCNELKEKNDNSLYDEIEKARFNINFFISELLDDSNGNIITNNDNIRELFKKLFSIACNIKQYFQRVEQSRSALRRAQNDNEIYTAVQYLKVNNALLNSALDKMLEITIEINDNKSSEK